MRSEKLELAVGTCRVKAIPIFFWEKEKRFSNKISEVINRAVKWNYSHRGNSGGFLFPRMFSKYCREESNLHRPHWRRRCCPKKLHLVCRKNIITGAIPRRVKMQGQKNIYKGSAQFYNETKTVFKTKKY